MNKDLQIAKKTIQTEIQALKKLSASFNRNSKKPRSTINIQCFRGIV